MLTFVTGPVRSGKSTLAQRLAGASRRRVTYCATAPLAASDPEWAERIARHVAERPGEWTLVETAGDGAPDLIALVRDADANACLLVDSLGTFVADLLGRLAPGHGENVSTLAHDVESHVSAFVDAAVGARAEVIVVGEEVGWGIVPTYPSGRIFRDVLGRAQQRLAAHASRAYLVTCGVAIDLKKQARSFDDVVAWSHE